MGGEEEDDGEERVVWFLSFFVFFECGFLVREGETRRVERSERDEENDVVLIE